MTLSVGDTVSRYELLEKIGEGGMGVVFRARDTRLGRDVALKFLPPALSSDPVLRERLLREARAAAALEHPAICPIYEIDEAEGQPFIAMAVAEGKDLHALLRERAIGVGEAIKLVMDAGSALAAAHAKQIVHRDIKPANVMVTDGGQVKVLDFGLAQTPDTSELTSTNVYVGTAAYMAPEQLAGEEYDHRSDIWALGVLLYELLTGTLPFKAKTAPAMMFAVISTVPEPVTALRANVPLGVEYVLNKALAKKPQDRYQRAEAMCADLAALLDGGEAAGQELRGAPGLDPNHSQGSGGGSPAGDDRSRGTGAPSSAIKLLVVDDEPDLELLMRQHFRKRIRAGDFEFSFAANGAEALEKLEADPNLQMVLTDIRMPTMDGLTFLGELAKLDRTVKAVVVSAYGDVGNIRTAMNRGAFDFLMKPIDFADLDATIDKTWQEISHYREAREVRRRLTAMEQEMDVARRIQSAVVPRSLAAPDWLERYAFVSPAREVGGDFHDLFDLGDGRVGIVLGEVFGSGVGAAVFAAVNRTLLKALGRAGDSAAKPLEDVGDLLRAEGLNAMSVTALFGILDAHAGTFRYCSAGHPHPYVLRADGDVSMAGGPTSPTLGGSGTASYAEGEVALAPGDSLFLYTDGIPDATDGERNIFSHERLVSVLRTAHEGSPAEVARAVVRAVDDFAGDAPQTDDFTAFVCRISA